MKTKTKRSLILALSDINNDPRPQRLIQFLRKNFHEIDGIYSGSKNLKSVNLYVNIQYKNSKAQILWRGIVGIFDIVTVGIFINQKRILKLIERKYNFNLEYMCEKDYDYIWVEDLDLLPIAFHLSRNSKIIFDAREYYPEQKKDLYFKIAEKIYINVILKKYLKLCDSILTVSPGIAKLYKDNFDVEPMVLLSTPNYTIQVNNNVSNKVKIVYHGSISATRGVSSLIKIMPQLDQRFELYIYPVGDIKEQNKLRRECKDIKSIHIMETVPEELVVKEMSKYDIGIMFFPPTPLNLFHCLPNKFFQNIHSGLALIVGPSPDMAHLVKKFNNGIIVKDFKTNSLISTINHTTAVELDKYKNNSLIAAQSLNYENESTKILELICE